MFTGLIESVGTITTLTPGQGRLTLQIEARDWASDLERGESVAVDGVCLSVTRVDGGGTFGVEAVGETLHRTIVPTYRPGRRVNLERALRLGDRLGGHLLQGHVDGIGTVVRVEQEGESRWLTVRVPGELRPYLVPQGPLALNGVSLTIARLRDAEVTLSLIPFTWEHTALADLEEGAPVNLEVDLVPKYLAQLLASGPYRALVE